jgi:hypothetical protein
VGSKEPRHKGVGLIPVVQGIKANDAARAQVPPSLAHYLTDRLLPSAWYPECDYDALLALLARNVDRKAVGGDVWAWFGRLGARRDVGGDERPLPKELRSGVSGTYRTLMSDVLGMDIAGLFQRGGKLWSLYHDTGFVTATRSPRSDCSVLLRLHDFSFACRGLMEMQTAYFTEFARLCKHVVHGEIASIGRDGCAVAWQYSVARTPENLLQVAAMPLADELELRASG